MMHMTGAQMLIEALRLEGVKHVFGYPGGAVLNIYDEIYKQDHFKHFLTRHEQAAVMAADGYARSSGEVGVAIVTSGPGFTNAVTGIATAYSDSTPMVIISGQVPTSLIGTDAFQEIDAVGISRPCTKHNYLVRNAAELPRIIKEAFYIARSGRPGPVHIDIPKDVTAESAAFVYPDSIKMKTYNPTYKGNIKQIKKAAEAIAKAKKPVLYIGGGAVSSGAGKEINELIELTRIPTVETLMALGTVKHDNPLRLGMVGMHGSYAANMAMSEADLMIAMGPRFDDRVTGKLSEFAKHAKIIHVDIDPSSIGKIVEIDYPIVGDPKHVLEDMIPVLAQKIDPDRYETWRKTLKRYNEIHPLGYKDSDAVLKPQWVIEKVGQMLDDTAVITTDVGQHQMWTAQFYPFSYQRQWVTSGGLGTMGFGLPSALGAKVANPDKTVINFSGDGSILMNIQDLMTATEYRIPFINVVLNNNYLGMVRQWQTMFYQDRLAESVIEAQPDFVKLVESFGGVGYRVTNKKEFEAAFKEAIKAKKVAIIEVIINRGEHVLPMVPTGGALYNMILTDKEQ